MRDALERLRALTEKATEGPRFWCFPKAIYADGRWSHYELRPLNEMHPSGLDNGEMLTTEPPGATHKHWDGFRTAAILEGYGEGQGCEGHGLDVGGNDAAYLAACSPEIVAAFVDLAVAADQTVNAPEVTGPGVLRDALTALRGVLAPQ